MNMLLELKFINRHHERVLGDGLGDIPAFLHQNIYDRTFSLSTQQRNDLIAVNDETYSALLIELLGLK